LNNAKHWATLVLEMRSNIWNTTKLLQTHESRTPKEIRAMKPLRKLLVQSLAVLTLLPAVQFAAQAQEFPNRRINIVVPFPPGGGADILSRVVAKNLTEAWGQPVSVENKPGAAGTIGANAVAASPPDGYTMVAAASGALLAGYAKTLAPVSLMSAVPFIVAAAPTAPFSNLRELIDYAKANPTKVFFGSSGAGSSSHLSGELFMGLTQTRMTHVPYKGMSQVAQDLIGSQVTLMFGPPPVLLPHIRSGKVKGLALGSKDRSPLFPELPSAAEAGVPNFEIGAWYGLLAPVGTPRDVINKISAETARALKKPEVVQALASIGATPAGSTPEEFGRYLDADIAKWDDLIKKAGVTK